MPPGFAVDRAWPETSADQVLLHRDAVQLATRPRRATVVHRRAAHHRLDRAGALTEHPGIASSAAWRTGSRLPNRLINRSR